MPLLGQAQGPRAETLPHIIRGLQVHLRYDQRHGHPRPCPQAHLEGLQQKKAGLLQTAQEVA